MERKISDTNLPKIGNSYFGTRTFTIIEMIVSMAILMLVLGGMFTMLYQGFRYSAKTKNIVQVINLARGKLEELTIDNTHTSWPPSNEAQAVLPSPFDSFQRQVSTSWDIDGDGTDDYTNNLIRIDVTIWWDGGSRQMTMSTLKAFY